MLAPGMKGFGRHPHDCLPLSRAEIAGFFLPQEQVYLRCARNAIVCRHFLAHLPYILANESRGLTKREVENGKREPYDATPHYVREPIR